MILFYRKLVRVASRSGFGPGPSILIRVYVVTPALSRGAPVKRCALDKGVVKGKSRGGLVAATAGECYRYPRRLLFHIWVPFFDFCQFLRVAPEELSVLCLNQHTALLGCAGNFDNSSLCPSGDGESGQSLWGWAATAVSINA